MNIIDCEFTKTNIVVYVINGRVFLGNTNTNIIYEVKKIEKVKYKEPEGYKKVKVSK